VLFRLNCHQIVTKTVQFFNCRSLALDICVRVAHRDADAGVSQQFFYSHDVDATVYEPGSKGVAQRVPRHIRDPRFFTSKSESSFQINKRFAGLRIIENSFILFVQLPSVENLASFRIYRNFADGLSFGCENSKNSSWQIDVRPAQRKNLTRYAIPYSERSESNPEDTVPRC
jgi:hypothetical protein